MQKSHYNKAIMKPIEFIKRYGLDKGTNFDRSAFKEDLTSEFIAFLELNKAKDNIKGFDNSVKVIKMKFDAINNKTLGDISSFWGFFFAAVIVPLREQLCPAVTKRRQDAKAERQKQYEDRKKFNDEYYGDSWSNLSMAFMSVLVTPTSSFVQLGLTIDATLQDVKSTYRKLSMKHHPDCGGKQAMFIQITEAKNKCIKYLSK